MNRIDRINEYGVKEVPDIFICNEFGDILYYSRTLKKVNFLPERKNKWRCEIKGAIGNIEDWYNIPLDSTIHTIYFRTFKRNKNTGEDEPLCFVITPDEIVPQGFSLAANSEPFDFPIVFTFNPYNLLWVDDIDCPAYEAIFDEEKDNLQTYEVNFIKPKRNWNQIKQDIVKERLIALKRRTNADKESD